MRTGKEIILATKPYAVDSSARSWAYLLSTGTLLAGALAGTLWNFHLAGRIVCSLLAGLLYLRCFVIYHDQQHEAILPHSRLAEVLMRLFGLLILSPSSVWRSSHNHHHNHNSKLRGSHIGSYPIMTKEQYLKASKPERFKYLFMRHPLTILFGYIFVFQYGMCLYPSVTKLKEHYDGLVAFVGHLLLAAGVTWFFGWPALVLTVIVPHFVASAIGSYLFYAQHNFPAVSFSDKAGWSYDRAALESSSFMKTGPILAWFTANIGYHHVHHLNSRIPFYRLPEVIAAIPELQTPRTTSLRPLEIIRCLRLKVWDVEAQRMVSLGEPKRHSLSFRESPGDAGPA
ncbi:MAG TPA: fatty acid desaturase [Candidatus Acidoferrum sp.]|jgi:omega-6 fatty acid desaturase (delta-12 desaturase)|nr:fatty acid desaturase [Candidatus Acidoferrum sp.]